MKRATVNVQGVGDACARSHKILDQANSADPEHDFELELIAALEEAELEVEAAEPATVEA